MRNVVKLCLACLASCLALCLAANNILLMRKQNQAFLLLWSLLIHSNGNDRRQNGKHFAKQTLNKRVIFENWWNQPNLAKVLPIIYSIHTFKQHYSSKEFVSLGKYQTTKVFHAGHHLTRPGCSDLQKPNCISNLNLLLVCICHRGCEINSWPKYLFS